MIESRQREIFAWGRRRNVSSIEKLKRRRDGSRLKFIRGRWV